MDTKKSENSTLSKPFIFVKARGHKTIPAKKLHFPTSYKLLIQLCNKLFSNIGVIRSLFSAEGKVLSSIDEILPGSTIFVSSLDPDEVRESQRLWMLSQVSDDASQRKSQREFDDNSLLDENMNSNAFNSLFSSARNESSCDKTGRNNEENSDANHSQTTSCLSSSKKKTQEVKYSSRSIAGIFTEVLGTDAISDKIDPGFQQLMEWMKKLLGDAEELEEEQRERWFELSKEYREAQLLSKSSNSGEDKELYAEYEIQQFIRKVINRHRFFGGKMFDYQFQVAILGPRKSGKTQILSMFSDEVLIDFLATDSWKQTFFVFFNFISLSPLFPSLEDVLMYVVDSTLQALAWQKPSISCYIPYIRKLFSSITTEQGKVRIPKTSQFYCQETNSAENIQNLINSMIGIWNEPTALAPWLSFVYSLPSFLSKAFGFSKTFFIIDNYEYADVEISGQTHFAESEKEFNITFIQQCLKESNYIIACEDQSRFFAASTPINGNDDMLSQIDVISTVGLLDEVEDDDRVIICDIQEIQPLQLMIEHCAGIPAYLHIWHNLNEIFDQAEGEENFEDDEVQWDLVTNAQSVVDLLFTRNEEESYKRKQKSHQWSITAVRRISKDEQ